MLASITPLGERGRQSRWGLTVAAFALAAATAGAATGAVLGTIGSVLLAGTGVQVRLAVFAAAAGVALVLDGTGGRVPGPRRQVNDRWRDEYRGWVYGAGYGAQLGAGMTTVILSAATYLALFAAILAASAAGGALVVGLFGLARGLQPLATWRIRRPEQLVGFHRWLVRQRRTVRPAGLGVLALLLAFAVAGAMG
jgi:hypothetical protein